MRLLISAMSAVESLVPWHKLPFPLAVLYLMAARVILRARNLHDTVASVSREEPTQAQSGYRNSDGSNNDMHIPSMGMAGTRFGRNVPVGRTFPEHDSRLLTPNPRFVSQELLARREFIPAETLSLLAAAWIQFQVHDWFHHGVNEVENPWELPLRDDDPWPERPMRVRRTRRDTTRTDAERGLPPTYANVSAHWWDGSQIYGSDEVVESRVRSGEDGKLKIAPDGSLLVDPESGLEVTGVTENWWIGLSLMHSLFTLEHNAICERLKKEYPTWSDEELFQHARLINAALMAKIHTVEWTPAILNHPVLRFGMRSQWWGMMGERFRRRFGRISNSEVISGIPGSRTDHHDALYAMTEEFVSVYRMHPLLPDEFRFRSLRDDVLLREVSFPEIQGKNARSVSDDVPLADVAYTFGTSHPGAITLHNFPRALQRLHRQEDGTLIDLAAVDVLRDRERGVPRYNEFRRLVHKRALGGFDELTPNREWAREIRRVYDNDIDRVDLMVGLYAEQPPPGFGFSDTAFRIFILMASRRLKSDRFFTTDFIPEVYTPTGMEWIERNSMSTVLARHFPELSPHLSRVQNAFAPWRTGDV